MHDIILVGNKFYIKNYSNLLVILKAFGFNLYELATTYHTAFKLVNEIGAFTISGPMGDIINVYPKDNLYKTYQIWCDYTISIYSINDLSLFDKNDVEELLNRTWALIWVKTEDAKRWLIHAGFTQRLSIPELKPLQPAWPQAAPEASQEADPQRIERKRKAVTQAKAAEACEVSVTTIQNWERGIRTPEGYPGRGDQAAFYAFSFEYKSKKKLGSNAREKNRAVLMDPAEIDRRYTKDGIDD
ncbi:MAG: helix-turn-helix transcriptional regulator [Desulfovibrio sp.]|jgi:DNA-binding transcriptional regulator YiaG|nr:helix-turn-helix transcriptional regulator [Desulfovibrio sp.]